MPRFPRPCPSCQTLHTEQSEFCLDCKAKKARAKEADPNRRLRKYLLYGNSRYIAERKRIKETATYCHLCKQPFQSREEITADHIIPGDINSPLAPAHKTCNSSRGNKGLPYA